MPLLVRGIGSLVIVGVAGLVSAQEMHRHGEGRLGQVTFGDDERPHVGVARRFLGPR